MTETEENWPSCYFRPQGFPHAIHLKGTVWTAAFLWGHWKSPVHIAAFSLKLAQTALFFTAVS